MQHAPRPPKGIGRLDIIVGVDTDAKDFVEVGFLMTRCLFDDLLCLFRRPLLLLFVVAVVAVAPFVIFTLQKIFRSRNAPSCWVMTPLNELVNQGFERGDFLPCSRIGWIGSDSLECLQS